MPEASYVVIGLTRVTVLQRGGFFVVAIWEHGPVGKIEYKARAIDGLVFT
jgi:hypothetical protein